MRIAIDAHTLSDNRTVFAALELGVDKMYSTWHHTQPSYRTGVLTNVSRVLNGCLIDQSVSAQVTRKIAQALESRQILEFVEAR